MAASGNAAPEVDRRQRAEHVDVAVALAQCAGSRLTSPLALRSQNLEKYTVRSF